jgi:hypothetical protein
MNPDPGPVDPDTQLYSFLLFTTTEPAGEQLWPAGQRDPGEPGRQIQRAYRGEQPAGSG